MWIWRSLFLLRYAHSYKPILHNETVCTMMTSSDGNIFRVTGHVCGEFTGHRLIPRTKAIDAELWCFFDLRLNKWLSKQHWGWWFETLSRPLWRQCNVLDGISWTSLYYLLWGYLLLVMITWALGVWNHLGCLYNSRLRLTTKNIHYNPILLTPCMRGNHRDPRTTEKQCRKTKIRAVMRTRTMEI